MNISKGYQNYVETMENELKRLYAISDSARSKGLDPALKTECIIAQDIADLVEGLVGPKDVALSIRELSTKMPREEVAFKVAQQIAQGKFAQTEQKQEQLAEQAIRTALAIFTEGLTAAPIQGIAQVKIKTNADQNPLPRRLLCWSYSFSRRNRPSFNVGRRRLRAPGIGA